MSERNDNPLLPGRWYTAQVTFNQYEETSYFVAGQEYLYCGQSHSHYDGATNLSFRDRDRSNLHMWWEDGEPASLLHERFGEPGPGFTLTPLKLLGLLALALVVAYTFALGICLYLKI